MIKKLFGKQWVFDDSLPGETRVSLEGFGVTKKILDTKTKYQKVDIFDTTGYGRVLFLDKLMQLSTEYEATYHEMLVHPALLLHPKPEQILIIGGGDGGALREVLKHPVKEAMLVEIDKDIITLSKKYLPSLSQGAFDHKKAKIVIGDGEQVIAQYKNYFDCIIMDSNDPDGVMAQGLFAAKFFQAAKKALRPGGIFITQIGYLSDTFGKKARAHMQKVFPFMQTHRAFIRHFMRDEHAFSLAFSHPSFSKITKSLLEKRFKTRKLKTSYYSPAMHFASLVFPPS